MGERKGVREGSQGREGRKEEGDGRRQGRGEMGNREGREWGGEEGYRIRIVENGEREEEKGKTRRKGGTGVERRKWEEKEGWKRKE